MDPEDGDTHSSKAATGGVLLEKVFLEISQNLQENTCARVYFLTKLQALACNFIKKEALAQVFSCRFCEISKNTLFTEHFWATASDSCSIPFTFIFKVTDNIIIINILLILLLLIVTDNIMKINSFTSTFQSFCQLFRSTY